jgi:hypothetical protein
MCNAHTTGAKPLPSRSSRVLVAPFIRILRIDEDVVAGCKGDVVGPRRLWHPAGAMARSLSLLSVIGFALGILLAGGGCATTDASAAKHVARTGLTAADYYPLDEGWKWAYDLEKDGEKILGIYAVIERTADGATILAGTERLTYATKPDGIAQMDANGVGDYVLKNPLTKDATWPVSGGGTARVVSTTEEVTVDAGHFYDCAVVEVTRADPPRLARTTFAPDVGPIVIEVQVQENGKYVVTTRARLRSTTKPGDDPFGLRKPR